MASEEIGKKSGEILRENINVHSDLEKINAELEESIKMQTQAAFEHASIGIAICNIKGRFLQVNPVYVAITGYPEEELLTMGFPAITHPDDINDNFASIQEIIDGKKSTIEIEKRYIRKDGKITWVQNTISLVHDAQANSLNFIVFTQDINGKKLAICNKVEDDSNKFQQLLESIPQITWTSLPSGEINFYNQKWYQYTGLTPEQTKEFGWQQVVHPDDLSHASEVFYDALRSENAFEMELRLRRGADEAYRWHIGRCAPLKDEGGKITFWVGTATDIHERKIAVEELKKLREWEKLLHGRVEEQRSVLHNLVMQAPAVVCTLKGPEHIFELVNPAYQKMFGSRPLAGKKIKEALPELAGQEILTMLDHVYRTGESSISKETAVAVYRDANVPAEELYFNFVYQALYDDNRTINGIFVFAYEVTEQVIARKSLEEYNQRIKMVLESLPMISWTCKPDGNIDYFNDTWYKYTGFTIQNTIDRNWDDALHEDDAERARTAWRAALSQGRQVEVEYRFRRTSDGMFRWHLGRCVPIKNNQGEIIKWVGTATDIHDQKRAQEQLNAFNLELSAKNEQLHRTNTDLDNFIYTASHDLKAPISNLEGLLNTFVDDTEIKGDQKVLVDMMFNSVERFKSTIKDLTEITHVQKGENEDFQVVKFDEMLEEVKFNIKDLISKLNAEIQADFKVNQINFSRKNLRSVIYNLVSNAIKYSSPERKPIVNITTMQEGEYTILSVSDNGLGMGRQNKTKIFGMFKRLHDHVEGTGVGLYIVKRMVENAGGKIEVDSELGKGSVFRVYFKG
jgi:PAS domain S-box-containing protein